MFVLLLTKVYQVHGGVKPGLAKDDPADELVEVDVVVEGQDLGQSHVPQDGDGVP